MEFESRDPDVVLSDMLTDRSLFDRAIITLIACENYDNHLPRGLHAFLAFFNQHREALHAGTASHDDLHRQFRVWLREAGEG